MRRKLSPLLFFFLIASLSFSKTHIDSLRNVLNKSAEDTNKAKTLYRLCNSYYLKNHDSAFYFASQLYELSQKINYKRGLCQAKNIMGHLLNEQGKYDAALENLLEAQKYEEQLQDSANLSQTLMGIGTIYYYMNQYEKTLTYWEKTYQISKARKDKWGAARMLGNIGLVYDNLKMYDKALEYYKLQLSANEETKQTSETTYNNIGVVYDKIGNEKEAMVNYLKAAEILENKKQLDIEDKLSLSNNYNNIGEAYSKLGNYPMAIEYCSKALSLAKEGKGDEHIKEIYNMFSKVYSKMGNYQKAFEYHQLYSDIKDTLLNAESTRAITEMNTKYETEKKEKEIEVQHLHIQNQESELNKKQITIYAAAGGIFLLLLLSFFIFRSYRQKQKANLLLAEKNILIEQQKKMVEEKNKDITDSINYAQRIQKALLASDSLLDKNLGDYFILFKPKDIVSGDFYWATETGGRFYLAACDSTGHGVPGAFMSLLNISFLNEAINEKKLMHPNAVFNHVRQRLIENISAEGAQDGMDGILICFDKRKNEITYAAANNPPLLMNGMATELYADSMPVGLGEKKESFAYHTINFKAGDVLYLCTDGFADQFGGPKGKKFKRRQLQEKLSAVSDKPLAEQKFILEKTFDDWKGNLEQVDDVLVIGIRI